MSAWCVYQPQGWLGAGDACSEILFSGFQDCIALCAVVAFSLWSWLAAQYRADQALGENAGRFQKGVSGNPGGRPREIGEIRDLARAHTADAIEALRGIAVDLTAPASARVAASEALLNRAWGRPSLAISAEGEAEPVELVVRWAGA